MMSEEPRASYGLSTNLFVSRKSSGESLVMGGVGEDSGRWTRVLSIRAAQMLWFHLTQVLFPEKSEIVTALVSTAPLRSSTLPTITTHMAVDPVEEGGVEIVGWVGDNTWWVRLTDYEARRFWTALDLALYPVGWQGKKTRQH